MVSWDRRSAICGFGLKNLAISRAAALRNARRLVAQRPLAFEGLLGEASRVPKPDARPFYEFPRPAVDAFPVVVAALPDVGAAAA